MTVLEKKWQVPTQIATEIFRAYDIRGIVDQALTEDSVYAVGLAFGSQAQTVGQSHVAVGRDGRLSSPRLSQALIQGLLDSGCNVVDIGCVPSPILYFATNTLATQSGIMVTGSHNPADYNGLKMVLAGQTLAEIQIQQLRQRIEQLEFTQGNGSVIECDVTSDYLDCIVKDVQLAKPLKIVIDCGNGIAGAMTPALFRRLGCDVIELFCEVDGRFPNHHPDPTIAENLQALQQKVLETNADIGLAFDGDADRLGVITDQAEIIWPDRQMIVFAEDVLSRNPGQTIVFDVKCTQHLAQRITAAGGKPLMYKTGHSLLKRKMQEVQAPLAGEMSGHIFFKERWYGFDDGLYSAARLLEIVSQHPGRVSDLFATIPDSVNTPELKIPIAEAQKQTFMRQLIEQGDFQAEQLNTIDGLRVEYANGWGLIRPSNTTPCLVLRFEADSQAALQQIQAIFKREIGRCDGELAIGF
ncbi:MAG: phosphomannomutase/phosphoglucomutase [Legionellales bacterium]|nr:phosphomannomutase/phosphoglucomutase [Legionellales bacterium]